MCLYLQTQSFQQRTAALVQDMHLSSVAANSSLNSIAVQLGQQQQSLQQGIATLGKVQQLQQQVQLTVQQGLTEVQKVGEVSLGLQEGMQQSLEISVSQCLVCLKNF
jgi:cytolysin (calcineurin-like family phosphatase)